MAVRREDYLGLPVLVTGGAGFIGSHLVRGLLDAGADVLVLDNFCNGTMSNLAGLESRLRIMTGDVTLLADCQRAVQGRAIVFHLAALGSVPGSVDRPLEYNRANVDGTLHILDAARHAGVKRVIYSASSSAYGDTPTLPKVETMTPQPKSPYAIGKLVGEYYCRVFAEVYGLQTLSLRYFNVFGPRQSPKSQYAAVIPAWVSTILQGGRPKVYGDGEQTRDFCNVANVVDANMRAGIIDSRVLQGEVVNVGCAENISLNAMLKKLGTILGRQVEAEYLPPRAGDVKDSLADITAIRQLLGYEPLVRFDEGLKQTVEWFAKNLPAS
jgi:nucleoside-diphosphate-sugar epimerase